MARYTHNISLILSTISLFFVQIVVRQFPKCLKYFGQISRYVKDFSNLLFLTQSRMFFIVITLVSVYKDGVSSESGPSSECGTVRRIFQCNIIAW